MDKKEKEIILNAIENTDVSEMTKKIFSAIVRLTEFDTERTLYMLLKETDNEVALEELDRLMLNDEDDEISENYLEFILGEIDYGLEVNHQLHNVIAKQFEK